MLKNAPRKWLIVIVFVAVSCSAVAFFAGYVLGRSFAYLPKIEERVYTDAENHKRIKQQSVQGIAHSAAEQQKSEIKYHNEIMEEKSEAANNE